MSTRTITDPADWRAGDVATVEYEGHTASGEVWESESGLLLVGTTTIRYSGGRTPDAVTTTVTREVPDLPTETGSVILGGDDEWPLSLDHDGEWRDLRTGGRFAPWEVDLMGWTPAKVVPA